ncbi:MAG: hypothetical protein EZS28_047093, partial [Streblomastix strix]
MRALLKAVSNKQNDIQITFPYVPGILIILFQFLSILFQSWADRHNYHFSVQTHGALNGLIYEKSLNLNLNQQSSTDTGKLLTLISYDVQAVCSQISTLMCITRLPVCILVPLAFVFVDFGVSTLIAVALIILLMFPLLYFSKKNVGMAPAYLLENDIRMKITNEVLHNIRVVKFNGLENVFIDRIEKARYSQVWKSFWTAIYAQIVNLIQKSIVPIVYSVLIPSYVFINNVSELDFPIKVMPDLKFLNLMTKETKSISQYYMAYKSINGRLNHIHSFLMLPELKQESYESHIDDENIALQIENGSFSWGDHVSVPVIDAETEKMKQQKENLQKKMELEIKQQMGKINKMDQKNDSNIDSAALRYQV